MDIKNIELKELRDRCLLFNQFLIKQGAPAHLFTETNALIEKAYQEKKIKRLKAAYSDNNEQIRLMPISMSLELKKFFKEKLDVDFDLIDKLRNKALERIKQKGKISKREDYELVISALDEFFQDETKQEEVKQLNELLIAFQNGQKKM